MTQIKASELRIGNLVQSGNGIYTVSAISDEGIHFIKCLKTGEVFDATSLSLIITPVPLTEERLLKFGIKKRWSEEITTNLYLIWDGENICIEQYSEGECPLPHIKYAHQLQNLFHALKNQELPITQ